MNSHQIRSCLMSLSIATTLLFLTGCSFGEHGSHSDGEHHGDAPSEGHGHDGADAGEHHQSIAGQPGKEADVTRTVAIVMSDAMQYTPASLTVAKGETLRLKVSNEGQLQHELVLGSNEEILEHHELMKRFPGMEHEEENQVSLTAGKTGEIIWTFTNAGTVDFACLQPGHYEAGMKGEIIVGSAE